LPTPERARLNCRLDPVLAGPEPYVHVRKNGQQRERGGLPLILPLFPLEREGLDDPEIHLNVLEARQPSSCWMPTRTGLTGWLAGWLLLSGKKHV
jgi:hypothetical protein